MSINTAPITALFGSAWGGGVRPVGKGRGVAECRRQTAGSKSDSGCNTHPPPSHVSASPAHLLGLMVMVRFHVIEACAR